MSMGDRGAANVRWSTYVYPTVYLSLISTSSGRQHEKGDFFK